MENETKNTLTVANATQISTDLFGTTKGNKITSLDINNDEDIALLINSQENADFKLNDCVGKTITVVGATIGEFPHEQVNEETGDVYVKKNHSLCLFDEDGNSYVTGSNYCYRSFASIVQFKGMPTREMPITVEVIKVPVENGRMALKLKLVVKK